MRFMFVKNRSFGIVVGCFCWLATSIGFTSISYAHDENCDFFPSANHKGRMLWVGNKAACLINHSKIIHSGYEKLNMYQTLNTLQLVHYSYGLILCQAEDNIHPEQYLVDTQNISCTASNVNDDKFRGFDELFW